MVLGICRAPAGKCDLKQIDPHTSRIRPGLWTVSEGWRVARSALGGRWCTRACPRHARACVSGTRLRALRAQMFPALGHHTWLALRVSRELAVNASIAVRWRCSLP